MILDSITVLLPLTATVCQNSCNLSNNPLFRSGFLIVAISVCKAGMIKKCHVSDVA